MTLTHWAVTNTIKGVTRILCRVEMDWIDKVPAKGPLILVCNHVNFLDIPLVYSHLQPRPVTGYVKVETWNNPFMGLLFDLWGAIPIERGTPDRAAINRGLAALKQGKILAISPEGTRSNDGCLKRGHPGVALVSQISGAPLLPLVYYGGERFQTNFRQLQRTDFHINVGRQFRVIRRNRIANQQERQAITDEIMYQLAVLLPPEYRGEYADMNRATTSHLTFDPT